MNIDDQELIKFLSYVKEEAKDHYEQTDPLFAKGYVCAVSDVMDFIEIQQDAYERKLELEDSKPASKDSHPTILWRPFQQ